MGRGEESKTMSDPKVEILERGEIFFFYRPKVGKEEAHSADKVQRLFIVLRPEPGERKVEIKQASDSGKESEKKSGQKSGMKKGKSSEGVEGGHGIEVVNLEKLPLLRYMIMGRKRLPDPKNKGRTYWGFVELVTTHIEDIKKAFQGAEYYTATRGLRYKPPARVLAEGVYQIVRHNPGKGAHTHLIYKLQFPPQDKRTKLQVSLNVKPECSFLIQIKNPEQPSSAVLPKKRRAVFPAKLQARLGHRRYAPADPPDFLNYEGCEFLLIAASENIKEELGLEIKTGEEMESPECLDYMRMFGEMGFVGPLF